MVFTLIGEVKIPLIDAGICTFNPLVTVKLLDRIPRPSSPVAAMEKNADPAAEAEKV